MLAVDCSRRMAARDGPIFSRLDRAIEAAIHLAGEARRAHVGAVTFDRRVLRERAPARRSLEALTRLLSDAQHSELEPDYAELFRHLRDRLRRRALIAVLTSPEGDPLGGASGGLAEALPLVVDRHRVLVAAVGDRRLRELAGLVPGAAASERLEDLHARASALRLLEARRRTLARIRAAGAEVLDADAAELEVALRVHFLKMVAAGPV